MGGGVRSLLIAKGLELVARAALRQEVQYLRLPRQHLIAKHSIRVQHENVLNLKHLVAIYMYIYKHMYECITY